MSTTKKPTTKPTTTTKRPAPFEVGPIKIRPIRGPHTDDPRSWYWRAELYRDGARITPWTGWGRREEVERTLAALVAKGTLEPAEVKPRVLTLDPARATVAELLGAWSASLRERQDITENTQISYRICARWLVKQLGITALVRLDRLALDRYRDQRLRMNGATGTVALELRVLHIAWTWGQQIGLCPEKNLSIPSIKVKPVRAKHTPSPDEVAAVVGHLSGWRRLGVLLLSATGARLGEVAGLRWRDLDLARGYLTPTGKTGSRPIPVAAPVLAELRRLPPGAPDAPLLGQSRAQAYDVLPRAIAIACRELQITPFTPHGLRRAAVDRLLRAGVDPGTAAALMGHTPGVMLSHYRKASNEDLEEAVRRSALGYLPAGELIPMDRRRAG